MPLPHTPIWAELRKNRATWRKPRRPLRRARDINVEFDDRAGIAWNNYSLGMILHKQHRFDEAEAAYNNALGIYVGLGGHQCVADTYHQLGVLEQAQNDLAKAETAFKKALETVDFEDGQTVAIVLSGCVLYFGVVSFEIVLQLLLDGIDWQTHLPIEGSSTHYR
jgi:tetratricopeptide (TPR) repeat protein